MIDQHLEQSEERTALLCLWFSNLVHQSFDHHHLILHVIYTWFGHHPPGSSWLAIWVTGLPCDPYPALWCMRNYFHHYHQYIPQIAILLFITIYTLLNKLSFHSPFLFHIFIPNGLAPWFRHCLSNQLAKWISANCYPGWRYLHTGHPCGQCFLIVSQCWPQSSSISLPLPHSPLSCPASSLGPNHRLK